MPNYWRLAIGQCSVYQCPAPAVVGFGEREHWWRYCKEHMHPLLEIKDGVLRRRAISRLAPNPQRHTLSHAPGQQQH